MAGTCVLAVRAAVPRFPSCSVLGLLVTWARGGVRPTAGLQATPIPRQWRPLASPAARTQTPLHRASLCPPGLGPRMTHSVCSVGAGGEGASQQTCRLFVLSRLKVTQGVLGVLGCPRGGSPWTPEGLQALPTGPVTSPPSSRLRLLEYSPLDPARVLRSPSLPGPARRHPGLSLKASGSRRLPELPAPLPSPCELGPQGWARAQTLGLKGNVV